MKSFILAAKAIFSKDLVIEFRSKQVIPSIIILGVLISWVFRIAAETGLVSNSVMAASTLLISLLFSVVWVSERCFAIEQHNECISALVLSPIDAGDIYITKFFVNVTVLCIFELFAVPVIFVLFDVCIRNINWLALIAVLLLINVGTSSIGTLFGYLVQGTRSTGSLLSILVMAVLAPMILPAALALFFLFGAIQGEAFNIASFAIVGDFKTAVGFLAAFDAIFVTLCWLLFSFVFGE